MSTEDIEEGLEKTGQAFVDLIREYIPSASTELSQDQIVDLWSEPEVPQGKGNPYGSDGYANEDSSGTTDVTSNASLQSVNGVAASEGESWYYRKTQELQVQHPDWDLAKLTDEMSELIWNNNYNALMNDIANSRTPEEREQKIREHQPELDNYKDSGIDVDNGKKYLRDNQGMETVSVVNKIASLISSYSYNGVEAQSILPSSNNAFDNVEYFADGIFTVINHDGVSSDEAAQQSEDRSKVLNGIKQEFSDFFGSPIIENIPLILAGTAISTGIELQNSANPLGLSMGSSKAAELAVKDAQAVQKAAGYAVDQFTTTALKRGDKVYGMVPGQSAWYTNLEAVESSGGSYKKMYEGLQIAPHEIHGYRTELAVYEVTEDMTVASSKALANRTINTSQGVKYLGEGGFSQYVIPDQSKLKLVEIIKLGE